MTAQPTVAQSAHRSHLSACPSVHPCSPGAGLLLPRCRQRLILLPHLGAAAVPGALTLLLDPMPTLWAGQSRGKAASSVNHLCYLTQQCSTISCHFTCACPTCAPPPSPAARPPATCRLLHEAAQHRRRAACRRNHKARPLAAATLMRVVPAACKTHAGAGVVKQLLDTGMPACCNARKPWHLTTMLLFAHHPGTQRPPGGAPAAAAAGRTPTAPRRASHSLPWGSRHRLCCLTSCQLWHPAGTSRCHSYCWELLPCCCRCWAAGAPACAAPGGCGVTA